MLSLTEEGMFASGQAKEWPTLFLFDQYGSIRLLVEFGPIPEPVLTIYEKTDPNSADLGIYALDPTGSKEVVVQYAFSSTKREGAISWLPHNNVSSSCTGNAGRSAWYGSLAIPTLKSRQPCKPLISRESNS